MHARCLLGAGLLSSSFLPLVLFLLLLLFQPQATAPGDSLLSLDSHKRSGAKGPKGKETEAATSQQSMAVEEVEHPKASEDAPAAAPAPRTTRTTSKASTATKTTGTATNTSQDTGKSDDQVVSTSSSSSSSAPTVTATAPLPELAGFSNLAQEIEKDMLAEIESLLSRKRAIIQPVSSYRSYRRSWRTGLKGV